MYVQRNNEARSWNHCCSGKAITITYSEKMFVALVIQQAMRMRHIVISGLAGSYYTSTIFFSHFPINGAISEKKNIDHETCVLILSTTFVRKKILILKRIQWDTIKNAHCSLCKVTVIVVRFQWRINFLFRFSKNTQITTCIKTVHWEPSCSMRTDGKQPWQS